MKHGILALSLLFVSSLTMAQNYNRYLEINPFIRLEQYPQFSYVLAGRPSTDYINIKGTSFGLNVAYKIPVKKLLFLKPGFGYYKYSFNNIKRENTSFGKSDSRNINFPSTLFIPFFTDKYHYDCISANIGLEKLLLFKNSLQGVIGFQINNYFTFSQNYHLTNNPEGSQNFKKGKTSYFGTSGLLHLNFMKSIQKISVGPSLQIPFFDTWKTDETFQEENNNGTRHKWWGGIGVGVSINYSLNEN